MLKALDRLERRWRAHFNVAPTDVESWRRARIYMLWFDHAVLRLFWTNQMQIAPGVIRSNHPTPGRLHRLKRRGVVSVLTLRGSADSAHYATEKIYCRELGLTLHAIGFSDKSAPPKASLTALIDKFRTIEKPFLMHCKSGADRAGLASALYLLVIEGKPLAEARRMLSPRFLHFKGSKTGVLDRVLDQYETESAGRDFETWLEESYDPTRL
ncbi:MAG: tyrosine-protein phosphatase [Rhodobacteraceae bacterium]|nr:tyrosine-protein phosphatase [Paracoccaceae bacterium]